MKTFLVKIYFVEKVDSKSIEAHNICSALIIMSGQLATIEKYKKAFRVTVCERGKKI